MSRNPNLQYLGPSLDGRTNRWRVTIPCCGKSAEPATTIFSRQEIPCPVCSKKWLADYNNQKLFDLSQQEDGEDGEDVAA